jgi:hypothetical protein
MTTVKTKPRPVKFPPAKVEMLRGAAEIAEFIKEDAKRIPELVKTEGLPAWKRDGRGPWRALGFELQNWMIRQQRKYLPNAKRDADADTGMEGL